MKKNEIKRILVPVDFTETSEIAITKGIEMARLLKADLFLIHVVEYYGYYFSVVPKIETVLPSLLEIEKAVEKKMQNIQQKIEKEFGIIPAIFICNGHVHSEIISFSQRKRINLIIMGTHGAAGYKELFAGSNAQRVVTLSDIPVLTIQQKKNKTGFGNILIPIDNSLHSREKVNTAMKIADLFGAKIHLIGLVETTDKKEVNEIKVKLDSVEKIISAENLPYTTSIVSGKNLSKAAMKYANENKCDLIVINSGHESRTNNIFPDAFTQQIVNHSKIPVLTCKHTDGNYSIDTPGYGIE